jgi:general stress protein 26
MPILYLIARKWKEVELWKHKHKTKEITRDKCIPLGIKDDNIPRKFVVLVENATLKDHNSYKSGLKNIEL